jgi:transposase
VALRPQETVLLFTDEVSFYRQPTQGWLWHRMGRAQPRLPYSHRSNTLMRVIGVLDAMDGRLQTWDYGKATAPRLGKCWSIAAANYPNAKKIYLVMDNWPVHFHKDALGPLLRDPRVEILPLPTYSPWLNNIEKAWRWVKGRVTHAHPWSNDFTVFREQVRAELQRASAQPEFRRYCGLESLFNQ